MEWGLCLDAPALPSPGDSSAWNDFWAVLQGAGIDYLELPVGSVMGTNAEFDALRALMAAAPLPVRAFNSFLPATQSFVGREINLGAVLEYCQTALTRCRTLGGDVVVLGSAGARRVPEGFDQTEAERQFIDFCQKLGPVAEAAGVDIAIEPLNASEDNLILSVAHGARLADEIDHPRIRLLADFYHMTVEREPLEAVALAGARLRHTHLADLGRVVPGFAPDGEADFIGFFRALRRAGYARRTPARCSFEGKWDHLKAQVPPMMHLLKERWQQSEEALAE